MLLRTAVVSLTAVALAALTACAPEDDPAGTAPPSSAADCAKDKLKLKTAGRFTVGTDKPAYAPWFADDTPTNGKGYESAVAFAVAKRLGFTDAEVTWVTVPFNTAFAPGPKTFDVDLNQISITPARAKAVDFSTGYYDVAQTVVTTKTGKIAAAKSIADLAGAKLGAQVGTTSLSTISDVIKPSSKAAVYDTNDLAVQALKNKQIDGIVVDLPTGFYMTAAQLEDGVIVGQLPAGGTPEQFGFVLDKGSALTPCVSRAVDALRADGTLTTLERQFLTASGAPELK